MPMPSKDGPDLPFQGMAVKGQCHAFSVIRSSAVLGRSLWRCKPTDFDKIGSVSAGFTGWILTGDAICYALE
jgi:hypothetical protein